MSSHKNIWRWISQINLKQTFLCGFYYTIISFIVHEVEALTMMRYYTDPQYFGLWSKIMMPSAGPPPIGFFITTLIISFVTGVSLSIIYVYMHAYLPKDFKTRVIYLTEISVCFSFLFFTLPSYQLFNIPPALLVSWFVSTFAIMLPTSYMLVKIIKI